MVSKLTALCWLCLHSFLVLPAQVAVAPLRSASPTVEIRGSKVHLGYCCFDCACQLSITVSCRSTSYRSVQTCLRRLFRSLGLACFESQAEPAAFLCKLDAEYAEYALALWQKGIRTPQQLADFSDPHYLTRGVSEGHIDDIKTRADITGEQLAYSNYQSAGSFH